MERIYPDSKVEIQGLEARHYDRIMNGMTVGLYRNFIKTAIAGMNIRPDESILDLGCGTGRNARLMHEHLSDEGSITGMDISEEMEKRFRENCAGLENIRYVNQRVDIPFRMDAPFDIAFISFVLHGFPQEVRMKLIENVYGNLKPGGRFCILDFSEFSLKEMPFYYRIPFKAIECPYAFDYIERDWKTTLENNGFGDFEEAFMFKKYVRLLTAYKK